MKISVVIAVYNEEKDVSFCIKSLLNQSLHPDEIIFVDDGSSDKTKKIIQKYPVTLLEQYHSGPGSARNLGSSKAKGDILIFVDADMTFSKDFVKDITLPLRKGKAKGVFNTHEYVSNFDTNVWARCWNYNQNLKNKLRMDPNSAEDSEDFRAILKEEFSKAGGFSVTGYTDSRTLVAKLGYRPTPENKAVSYHANPATLREIYYQSRWIGKRKTKFGLLGKLLNLVKYSFVSSVVIGLYKSIIFREFLFLVFKIVYDYGYFSGVLISLINKTDTAK